MSRQSALLPVPPKGGVFFNGYGTVNWKGRNLDGIVIKATVKMASAERGQYKDECFLFGAVVDHEFEMIRDPYESKCNDTQTSTRWAAGHELKSLWVAN